jgi:hypothetical protein
VLLIAIVGEELTEAERVIFKGLTGREREPGEPCSELWCVIGSRTMNPSLSQGVIDRAYEADAESARAE